MECDGTAKSVMLSQKIRMHPTAVQARTLRKWAGCARQVYNRALHLVKNKKQKCTLLLKKLVVTQRKHDTEQIKKSKDCPADILTRAVKDLIDDHTTAWAGVRNRKKPRWSKKRRKKQKRNIKQKRAPFNIKYKSKRATSGSFGFESKSLKPSEEPSEDGFTVHLFAGKSNFKHALRDLKLSEAMTVPAESCVRISYHCGRWYLLIPRKQTVTMTSTQQKSATAEPRVIALDPGARTMLTYFSVKNQEWGSIATKEEVLQKLTRVTKKQNALQQRLKNKTGAYVNKGKKIRRAWYRQLARARYLITDLHYKIIKWLTTNYDVIISPKFSTSDMQKRSSTNLNAETRQVFRYLSHFTFRERLLNKCAELGKVVVDVHEAGTTQGCSMCGFKKLNVGRSEVYKCDRCPCVRPRDMNSSVAMYLKAYYGSSDQI